MIVKRLSQLLLVMVSMNNFINSVSAYAASSESYPIIRVTSEKYPGEEYFLGVENDAEAHLKAIYYEDDSQKGSDRIRHFSPKELEGGVTLVQNDGYNLVRLKIHFDAETGIGETVLQFLYFAPKKSKYTDVKLRLEVNPHTRRYELLNSETNTVAKEAYVKTHVANLLGLKKEIGIEDIEIR